MTLPQIDDVQGHNQARHRLKNRHHWQQPSSLRCMSAVEHHTAELLQNWQDKTPKASPEEQPVMKYSPWLSLDTRLLRSCSGNWAKMVLKSHLGIKCHSQYIKVNYSFSTDPPIVNEGDWECILRDLETIVVLVLLAFNLISQRLHHSLTLLRSRFNDSATATLPSGDSTTATKVESSA